MKYTFDFQIYISFVSALIVTPPTILLIYLFKLSKPKPSDPNQPIFRPRNSKQGKYKLPFMRNWLEREYKNSLELEKHLVQKGYPSMEGLRLPYWVKYVAWFLVFAIWFLCAFFIMLYSMEWGKNKSEEWVTTFLLSFCESVFCLDPVKVYTCSLFSLKIFFHLSTIY